MATRTMHTDPFRSLRPIRESDPESATTSAPTFHPLAYDVYREGGDLVLEFDVPGIDPSEVEVVVEDRHVVVNIRREPLHRDGVDLIERGRSHGRFSQRLLLGASWDLEQLEASTRHGVLRLRAPHLAERVRRTVRVGDADAEMSTPSIPERVTRLDEDRSVHSAA